MLGLSTDSRTKVCRHRAAAKNVLLQIQSLTAADAAACFENCRSPQPYCGPTVSLLCHPTDRCQDLRYVLESACTRE